MAVTDTPFQPRDIIVASSVSLSFTDKEKLQLQVQLDIRDLLSRISVASGLEIEEK